MNEEPLQHAPPSGLAEHFKSPRNSVGFALMIGGVLSFAVFHFLEESDTRGWEMWKSLIHFIRHRDSLEHQVSLLGHSGFVTLAISTTASPFLISWLIQNPWLKWCLASSSAMAAGIMWYFIAASRPDPWILTLGLSPTLTLAGLLCIRTVPRHLPAPGPN